MLDDTDVNEGVAGVTCPALVLPICAVEEPEKVLDPLVVCIADELELELRVLDVKELDDTADEAVVVVVVALLAPGM